MSKTRILVDEGRVEFELGRKFERKAAEGPIPFALGRIEYDHAGFS